MQIENDSNLHHYLATVTFFTIPVIWYIVKFVKTLNYLGYHSSVLIDLCAK